MPPKKHAGHREERHGKGKDVRRAFEHVSRVRLLLPAMDRVKATPIEWLMGIAQQQLAQNADQQAADLLRAAEHMSFAALEDGHSVQPKLSADLVEAIRAEFRHLRAKAAEHWKEESSLSDLYHSVSGQADQAFKKAEYYRALELQRAAQALAHVKPESSRKLPSEPKHRTLAES